MSSEITRFELVPTGFTADDVTPAVLEYARDKDPMVLTYVWEKDPANVEAELKESKTLFEMLHIGLREAETGRPANTAFIHKQVEESFSEEGELRLHLGYEGQSFYSISMGPRHTSRFAPCFSFVLNRLEDVALVPGDVMDAIQANAHERYGEKYDSATHYLKPKIRKKRK